MLIGSEKATMYRNIDKQDYVEASTANYRCCEDWIVCDGNCDDDDCKVEKTISGGTVVKVIRDINNIAICAQIINSSTNKKEYINVENITLWEQYCAR